MKLINNFKGAWKFFSVQVAALIIFIGLLEPYMPELKELLPHDWYIFASICVILARVIKQHDNEPD